MMGKRRVGRETKIKEQSHKGVGILPQAEVDLTQEEGPRPGYDKENKSGGEGQAAKGERILT